MDARQAAAIRGRIGRGHAYRWTVSTDSSNQQPEAVEELDDAAKHRREADSRLSMSERLAALHELCKQAAKLDGTARRK
jgi:hypothetical protein